MRSILSNEVFEELIDALTDIMDQLSFPVIKDFNSLSYAIDSQGFIQAVTGNRSTIKYVIFNQTHLEFSNYDGKDDIEATVAEYHKSVKLIESIVPKVLDSNSLTEMSFIGKDIVLDLMSQVSPDDYYQIYPNMILQMCDNRITPTLAAGWNINEQRFVIYYNETNIANLAITSALTLLAKSPLLKQLLMMDLSNLKREFDILVNYTLLYFFLHELSHIQYRDVVNNAKMVRDSLGGKGWKAAGMDNKLEDSYINDRLNLRIGGMKEVANVLSNLDIVNFDIAIGISGRLNDQYFINPDLANQSSVSSMKNYFTQYHLDVEQVELLFNFLRSIDVKQPVLLSALNMNCAKGSYIDFIGPYVNLVKAITDLEKPIRKMHLVFSSPQQGSGSGSSGNQSDDSNQLPKRGEVTSSGGLYGIDDNNERTYHIYGPRDRGE